MNVEKNVGECIDEFLLECKLRKSLGTYKTYGSRLKRHFLDQNIRQKCMSDFEECDVQEIWKNIEIKAMHPTTHRAVYDTVVCFLKWCIKKNYMGNIDICKGANKPESEVVQPILLGTEELDTVLKFAEASDLYLPILIAATTGLRRYQVLGLVWNQIDFSKHLIYVSSNRKLDDNKMRGIKCVKMVPKLEAVLYEIFLELREKYSHMFLMQQFVCKTVTGRKFDLSYFDKKFRRFVNKNGLPRGLRFQDFYWSYVKQKFDKGASDACLLQCEEMFENEVSDNKIIQKIT